MTPDPNTKNGDNQSHGENTGLSNSRAEFAASLTRRLESLLGALQLLQQFPSELGRRDNFLRRVHALGASTRILGFAAAAEVLARAEQVIRTSAPDSLLDDIVSVRAQLTELPALVLRGQYSLVPPSSAATAPGPKTPVPQISEPLAAVVWGTSEFVETLASIDRTAQALEILAVDDSERLKEACVTFGPDVLLLDAQQGAIAQLVDQLAQAPETATIPVVVANVPDHAAARLRELGARLTLPFRASASQLSRALLQVRHASFEHPTASPSPLGTLTLKELAERLSQEIRVGLVDAAPPGANLEQIQLGDGTPIRAALWSALAQIREYVTENTERRIQFATGPEGGVPLAPRGTPPARLGGPSKLENLDLTGRRILVVDDDPAVAWFVAGTLRAAGATVTEVHDGNQALQLAYRLWPELIVSDVVMPGLDGFALCHATKHDVLLRDVPIILLSWKEDLLFRLRELGADADGYLRKEANASTIVGRVKELLLPRNALEQRLSHDRETRGRLDGVTTRLLLELAAALPRPVRISLRDATSHYDIRVRHGSLAAISRTRSDGKTEAGETVLGPLLGTTAGRFSVVTDHDPCESSFSASLFEILAPTVTRARAAQRLLSGLSLGLIDQLTLDADAFGSDLPMLPLSLRPVADELLRGTAPRQLLASGVASIQLLESLLSNVARRGAVLAICDSDGNDLLEREIAAVAATPSIVPPKPPSSPPQLFSFQLSPTAPPVADASPNRIHKLPSHDKAPSEGPKPNDTSRAVGSSVTPKSSHTSTKPASPLLGSMPPASNAPPDDIDWALELNWDTPPLPAQQQAVPSDSFSAKPSTSGGFMRPSIATLERNQLQETPDLANAVAQAVSEVVPNSTRLASAKPAVDPSHPKSTSTAPTATQRSPNLVATEAPASVATTALSSSANAASPTPSPAAPSHATRADGSITSAASATTHNSVQPPVAPVGIVSPASPAIPSDASRTPSPQVLAPIDSIEEIVSPEGSGLAATSDVLATSSLEGLRQTSVVPAPQPSPQVTPQVTPLVLDALLHASQPQEPSGVAANPPESSGGTEIATLSPRAVQSDVQSPASPDTPQSLIAADEAKHTEQPTEATTPAGAPDDYESETDDPVFPLVSATNSAVDVQPSIDVGTAASHGKILVGDGPQPTEKSSTEPPQPRDTLRSQCGPLAPQSSLDPAPESLPNEPPKHSDPPSATNVASTVNPTDSKKPDRGATIDGPPSSLAARQRSPRPPSAPPSSPIAQPRPIGLIQALGLAALAGIVTFAATIPIAAWFHRHRQPQVIDEANGPNPLLATSTTADGTQPTGPNIGERIAAPPTSGAPPTASEEAATQAPAKPRVQDLGVSAESSLAPGQALLEVATGGGHAIFVDDVFVGRGPVRVITVQAGHHLIRTRLNGIEQSDAVDIEAGHSVRLSIEQP